MGWAGRCADGEWGCRGLGNEGRDATVWMRNFPKQVEFETPVDALSQEVGHEKD
jgi:hypothetical protein